jgi:uridine monophosphate synthetase
VGSEICLLKTHIDLLDDFTPSFIPALQKLAARYEFLLFEDRKFADIGNTVRQQYGRGVYRIAEWAHLVNAHSLPGPGIIQGLSSIVCDRQDRGALLIAQMSSAGHLLDHRYRAQTVALAEKYPEFVVGFITQQALSKDPRWLYLAPGVQLAPGSDLLGQQYVTPEKAIEGNGIDIIIVGRGILTAHDRRKTAQEYRARAWNAYLERIKHNPVHPVLLSKSVIS